MDTDEAVSTTFQEGGYPSQEALDAFFNWDTVGTFVLPATVTHALRQRYDGEDRHRQLGRDMAGDRITYGKMRITFEVM